jgi:hypothetical protein
MITRPQTPEEVLEWHKEKSRRWDRIENFLAPIFYFLGVAPLLGLLALRLMGKLP